MTTLEIRNAVVTAHNLAVQVMVSGNNAILMGDALRTLRGLAADLNAMLEMEVAEEGASTGIMEAAKKAAADHIMQTYGGGETPKQDEVA